MRSVRAPHRATVAVLVVALSSTSCGGRADANDLVVSAAASLTEAFSTIGEAFEAAHPGRNVTFNFGASSELVAQVLDGAPVDVIATADLDTMVRLVESDMVSGTPAVFATNRAELVVAPGNPLEITEVADLDDADDDVALVVCAPQVPCGTYASEVFELADVEPAPRSFEANAKAVVTKVALGEADVGIAYATDVLAARGRVDGVVIPPATNITAEYPIAVTARAADSAAAREFIEFVLGPTGRSLLTDQGFGAP